MPSTGLSIFVDSRQKTIRTACTTHSLQFVSTTFLFARRIWAMNAIDALAAIEEAIEFRRGLAEKFPFVYNPSLAGSLHTLSERLKDLDREEDTRLATKEAGRLQSS
jgi:hypothetical protein